MSEEKTQVLRLLEQGIISYEEALTLLQALGGTAEGERPTQESKGRLQADELACDCGEDEEDAYDDHEDEEEDEDEDEEEDEYHHRRQRVSLGEDVGSEIREALQEAGREVNSALNEVGEELRNLGRTIDLPGLLQGIFSGVASQYQSWHETKEISVDGSIERLALTIANKNGNLRVLATEGRSITSRLRVRVQADDEAEARELAEAYIKAQQTVDGDQLQLTWRVTEQFVGSVSFEILIPRRLLVLLDLSSKNGSVTVEDGQVSGKITTKNGSVAVDNMAADELDIETKNGGINVRASVGVLTATTKNGSVRCSLEPVRDGRISLAATNGSVQAELACGDEIGYEVDAHTRSGRVAAELPGLVLATKEKGYISGSTGNWEHARIKTQLTALSKNGNVDLSSR